MDIMPRVKGHCLVIPKGSFRNMLDASPEIVSAVHVAAQKVSLAALKAFSAQGITIQQFNESVAGQEVFHYHVHVMPRYDGSEVDPPGIMGDMEEIESLSEKLKGTLHGMFRKIDSH